VGVCVFLLFDPLAIILVAVVVGEMLPVKPPHDGISSYSPLIFCPRMNRLMMMVMENCPFHQEVRVP